MPRIFWATTHPHGFTRNVASGYDARDSSTLREYAKASMQVAASVGIRYIDIHGMADALHDLSYDGAHFGAPVEPAIAKYVLTCAASSHRLEA